MGGESLELINTRGKFWGKQYSPIRVATYFLLSSEAVAPRFARGGAIFPRRIVGAARRRCRHVKIGFAVFFDS